MDIRISKKVAQNVGIDLLKKWANNTESWSWATEKYVSLAAMHPSELNRFEKIFQDHKDVNGVKVILKDIATWRAALTGGDKAKPRAVRNFKPLLMRVLGKIDGHRVYEKYDSESNIWLAYYVNEITYHPEQHRREGDVIPAHVTIELLWEELGGKHKKTIWFYGDGCIGMTVLESLARKNLYVETPELRAAYLEQAKRFGAEVEHIGKQFFATGTATDDMDGNNKRESSWYWNRTNTINLNLHGEPSRVVIDVFVESEENNNRDSCSHPKEWFWLSEVNASFAKARAEDTEDDFEEAEIAEDLNIEKPEIEVPIHPMMAVFCLRRHLRLRIHLNYLREYVYDTTIADKLVIPEEQKALVKMLINHKSNIFTDIVAGKAGGAVVLLTGKPGVGKTLTAEVYAESEQRALYSVQCSQLGTDPNELEDELLKVFARAKRWNAVMLLDEADVYVHERGNDMEQNAIVGVFLRVLEYQSTVLFLTTNRPDDVDDAIASRCIARLSYGLPNSENQERIWRILANASKIAISDKTIKYIVTENPDLSGRDVKNLLKLARLMVGTKEVEWRDIEFVKQFKPTGATV